MTFGKHGEVTKAEAERLAVLIEEAAEVQQAACKVLRHGWSSCDPTVGDSPTNRARLAQEFGDLLAAGSLLMDSGDIGVDYVERWRKDKRERMKKWLHDQPGDTGSTASARYRSDSVPK